MLKGKIESIDDRQIIGWCFNENHKNKPLKVDVYVDGELIGSANTEICRPHIQKNNKVEFNCGFIVQLPKQIEYFGQDLCVKVGDEQIKTRFKKLLRYDKPGDIKRIQIYGERASGTNFLKQLCVNNFPNLAHTSQYGWKHFFPPEDFPDSDNCLFIIIYRNPIDWLRSLYKQPHHVHHSLKNISFSNFIRHEWHCIWDKKANVTPDDERYGKEMMFERNPKTGERFANVLELRYAKIQAFNSVKNKVKHCYFINYEELNRHPNQILNEIADVFALAKMPNFIPVNTYKGITKKAYKPKKYIRINKKDYNFILHNIDFSLENKIGYSTFNTRKILLFSLNLQYKNVDFLKFKNLTKLKTRIFK